MNFVKNHGFFLDILHLDDKMEAQGEKIMAGTRAGAKKAWKTIRTNKNKRRKAALKAWETRRKIPKNSS